MSTEPSDLTRIAIVGASGYTGAEVIRLLSTHPRVKLTMLCAREKLVSHASAVLPQLTGLVDLPIEAFDPEAIAARAGIVFSCLPHGASIEPVRALHERGVRVLDLSADFRLRDPATYAEWYGHAHDAPALLADAVYGLPELNREALRRARLVAVPGCYPTASTLPLLPLLAKDTIDLEGGVVIHALSGVSGAGRTPAANTHFAETSEGARPYKVAGAHRHTPEIEQTLSRLAKRTVAVTFTPTLVPMNRGILATSYTRPHHAVTAAQLITAARAYFDGSPSVTVLDEGVLPDTLWVRGSNRAHIAYAVDRRAGFIVSMCAIDNLVKGASGQAIQCMNLMMGWDEGLGLRAPALWP